MFVDVKLDKEADNKLVIANLDFGIYHKSVWTKKKPRNVTKLSL